MKNLKGLDAHVKRVTLALTVAALVQAGSALAALELRDINGSPTAVTGNAEFAYDTVLNATWYLTANNTGLNWDGARSWASGLTVGTFSGWSLPSTDDPCSGYNCTNSQMGELYYTALGNAAHAPVLNTGPFKNLQRDDYWSGTEYAPNPYVAWLFGTAKGEQGFDIEFQLANYKTNSLFALAVRPGDVAAVPEPGTVALLLSGLAGMLVMRRRPVRS